MRTRQVLFVAAMAALLVAGTTQAQVPRPTLNITGTYFYDAAGGTLDLSGLVVTQVEYLDGSFSTTDAIVGATFAITGLTFTGIDSETGEAVFTDGAIVVSKDGVTFMTGNLVDVRLVDEGFGDFGNLNVGFGGTNITNLVFASGTGSQFVDEFAALIAPGAVPNDAKIQLEIDLLFPFGPTPTTFEENFTVSSFGIVLGVLDGAPVCTNPPVIVWLDGTPLVVPVGSEVAFIANFTDPDATDQHTATWDFGDYSGLVTYNTVTPAAPVTPSHTYGVTGIYTVTFTVTDGCGNSDTADIVVVVYDPATGFTTGGGWFVPDSESVIDGVPVTDTKSKANFGFIVKYKKGADTPNGRLEFVYKAGDINLHSTDMQWLVIQSDKDVRFKGQATINGEGSYTFKVSARDNGEPGDNDTFKIEIWMGVVDTENGPPTPKHTAKGVLGGGNIKIHQ